MRVEWTHTNSRKKNDNVLKSPEYLQFGATCHVISEIPLVWSCWYRYWEANKQQNQFPWEKLWESVCECFKDLHLILDVSINKHFKKQHTLQLYNTHRITVWFDRNNNSPSFSMTIFYRIPTDQSPPLVLPFSWPLPMAVNPQKKTDRCAAQHSPSFGWQNCGNCGCWCIKSSRNTCKMFHFHFLHCYALWRVQNFAHIPRGREWFKKAWLCNWIPWIGTCYNQHSLPGISSTGTSYKKTRKLT